MVIKEPLRAITQGETAKPFKSGPPPSLPILTEQDFWVQALEELARIRELLRQIGVNTPNILDRE